MTVNVSGKVRPCTSSCCATCRPSGPDRADGALEWGYNIEERLARWLLMCRDRLDSDDLPLTHEFLSIMLVKALQRDAGDPDPGRRQDHQDTAGLPTPS